MQAFAEKRVLSSIGVVTAFLPGRRAGRSASRLLPVRASGVIQLRGSRRCPLSGRYRCLCCRPIRRGRAPGLPVEDDQAYRHDGRDDAEEQIGLRKVRPGGPQPPYGDGPLGGVRHERYEHAAAGVVEDPRVPERHRDRSQEVADHDLWVEAALLQEEDWRVPAAHEHAEDQGGHQRRETGPLQPGEGEASPAGLFAQRPSPGLTRRTANTRRTEVTEPYWTNVGALASRATLRPAVRARTASGNPMAARYQYHLTRQRIIRGPSSRKPGSPWAMGITMSAATRGRTRRRSRTVCTPTRWRRSGRRT